MPILFSPSFYSFYIFFHNSKDSNLFPNFYRYIQYHIYAYGFLTKFNLQLLTVLENTHLTIDITESRDQLSLADSWFVTYRLKEKNWQGCNSYSASISKITTSRTCKRNIANKRKATWAMEVLGGRAKSISIMSWIFCNPGCSSLSFKRETICCLRAMRCGTMLATTGEFAS